MILIFLLLTAGMNGAFLSSILAEITNIAYESGIEPHLAATILVGLSKKSTWVFYKKKLIVVLKELSEI